MKVQLKTLLEARGALNWLVREKLPIMVAYRLNRAIKAINAEIQNFEEIRVRAIKELSDGGEAVPQEKLELFTSQMNDVLRTEVVIDMEPLELGQLPQTITVDELSSLEFLLKD